MKKKINKCGVGFWTYWVFLSLKSSIKTKTTGENPSTKVSFFNINQDVIYTIYTLDFLVLQ